MPSCAVATCKNTDNTLKQGGDFSFHPFPKNTEICKVWLQKCRRQEKVSTKTAVICSDHFNPDDFEEDKMNKMLNLKQRSVLKRGVIPTLNLPMQKIVDCSRQERLLGRQRKNILHSDNVNLEAGLPGTDCGNMRVSGMGTEDTVAMNQREEFVQTDLYSEQIDDLQSQLSKEKQKNARLQGQLLKSNHTVDRFARIFSPAQLKLVNESKRVWWSSQDIAKSLSLMSTSSKAYETIRKIWKLPLPSTRTLRKYRSLRSEKAKKRSATSDTRKNSKKAKQFNN